MSMVSSENRHYLDQVDAARKFFVLAPQRSSTRERIFSAEARPTLQTLRRSLLDSLALFEVRKNRNVSVRVHPAIYGLLRQDQVELEDLTNDICPGAQALHQPLSEVGRRSKQEIALALCIMKVHEKGSQVRHTKVSKKCKGAKKPTERFIEDPNSSDSQEKITQEDKNPEPTVEIPAAVNVDVSEEEAEDSDSAELINDLKKTQVEKRKQEGSEWKALKKTDCQRLETVVEEGQLSSEESPSKLNCLEGTREIEGKGIGDGDPDPDSDVDVDVHPNIREKQWKPRMHLMSIDEQAEQRKSDEEQQRKPQSCEKGCAVEKENSRSEPDLREFNEKLPASKKSVNLNGMMEIFPIFSNDKFACSRDAISIEEYDDFEAVEKNTTASGKALVGEGNVHKKEFVYGRDFQDRVVDSAGDTKEMKEMKERKLRYKILTDRNLTQQTSSHFINSLLVLTSFVTERERFLKKEKEAERVLAGDSSVERNEVLTATLQEMTVEDEAACELKAIPTVMLTTIGLFSIALGIAWQSYEPPRVIDYILPLIPFIRHRRTLVQLFFDKLLKLLSGIFNV